MKISHITIGILAWLSQSAFASDVLTLEQCYNEAESNYPLTIQRGLLQKSEQFNLSNAAKGWLPQVSVNAQASYQSDVTQLPFDTEALNRFFPGTKVTNMSKDQYKVYAEVNQTIWDGGAIGATQKVTSAQSALHHSQLDNELYRLKKRVNQLYFGCLLQDELIAQNRLLQKELQTNIERIEAMIANGVANQTDRESLEVECLNAQQREKELQASRKAYGAMLCSLIGRDADSELSLTQPANPVITNHEINRPELSTFEARKNVLDAQLKRINSAINPHIGAFVQGGYGRPGLNMLEDKFKPYYIIGARLSWNIGKLYTLKNDRNQIANSLNIVNAERETFLLNTRLQLIQGNAEIKKLSDQMATDTEIIRLRGNIKKAAEVKLNNGVISVSDMIREINAEDLAKQNSLTHHILYLKAVYDYLDESGEGWNN